MNVGFISVVKKIIFLKQKRLLGLACYEDFRL